MVLVTAGWNQDFIDEHVAFPQGTYQDQVDAAAGAFNKLALGGPRKLNREIFMVTPEGEREYQRRLPTGEIVEPTDREMGFEGHWMDEFKRSTWPYW